jgi:hypothetical protein
MTIRVKETCMRRQILRLLLIVVAAASTTVIFAQPFSPSDKLLILVKGNVASTSMFGFSGEASLYQSVGTNADGTIQFSPVAGAQDVPVERNSAADFTNLSNYGTGGFIPPGVYFLHYHRLDTSIHSSDQNVNPIRHRLGLSDDPGAETILSTAPDPQVSRTNLQFHIAFNNLAEYNAEVSEGCITLTSDNFAKLFPDALFDSSQSPLAPGSADPNVLNLQGSRASVLVFVTDVLTSGAQDQQIQLFDQTRRKLKPTDFAVGGTSQLPQLRVLWKAQGGNIVPTGLQTNPVGAALSPGVSRTQFSFAPARSRLYGLVGRSGFATTARRTLAESPSAHVHRKAG